MLQTTKSNTVIVGHRREEVRLEWMEVPKSAPLKTMVNLKEKINKREGEIERKIAERKLAGGRLPGRRRRPGRGGRAWRGGERVVSSVRGCVAVFSWCKSSRGVE